MKHLLNFHTKQAFNMAQLNLEKPYIALTDDDGKVSLSNGYILNPNWYLKEGGNYYQMKQKEDGVGETSVSLLDGGWELTDSDDDFYYYKTIYSYLESKRWAQIKVSWSGTTEMNFKYKSACSGGDAFCDYLEFSKLDIVSFNPQDYGKDGPRADSEHIASSAKGTYDTEWKDYTVHCDNGAHSLIFVFTTDGPCDENEYGEIAIPKKYVTYSVKKGDEIPTTYATDGKSAKIINGQPTKMEYKAITLPNGNDVILDMTDTQETQLTINTEYVDLGLSVKWATMNIGAEKESDYGIMFAWGQTDNAVATNFVDSKNYPYTWATYEHCDGTYDTLTKYNTSTSYGENPDNITTLETVDDAATQIMGVDWRMPTKADFDELLSGTTNEWIANYNETGVNGWKFTSKKDTSKYIFIPAAGYCNDGSVDNVGSCGVVWSSSLNTSGPYIAWYLNFNSGNCGMDNLDRYYGLSVRGVRK